MKQKAAAMLRRVPMVATMGTLFFLSHQTGDQLTLPKFPGMDKIAHLAAYAVLAATVLFSFSKLEREKNSRRAIIFTLSICFLFGISDEFHQSFIPGRSVSGYDLLADFSGALISCILWLRLRSRISFLANL